LNGYVHPLVNALEALAENQAMPAASFERLSHEFLRKMIATLA
jgi:hypothetical protein